jgi:glycosyltransferase involved in cell wall biosynthesis
MRIGIDARQLRGAQTGVGQYLSGLISEWSKTTSSEPRATSHEPRATSHEFVLYVHRPVESATIGLDARKFTTRLVPGSGGTWWEQVQLPRKTKIDHLDVFFAPQYSAPLALKIPTVVAIHDVSFAAHPEWFRTREGARLRWLARHSAANARAIITISEFSRREIVEHLKVPDDRVHVIPPGIPERHTTAGGTREARVLFAGTSSTSFARSPRLRERIRTRRSTSPATIAAIRMRTSPPQSPANRSATRSAGINTCRTSSSRTSTSAPAYLHSCPSTRALG